MKEIDKNFNELLNSGWKKSEPFYGMYSLSLIDNKGREHQIQFDDVNRPHLITIHRIHIPGSIISDGLIGGFVGGKGRKRATNYKKYLDLNYINNIKSYLDSKIK